MGQYYKSGDDFYKEMTSTMDVDTDSNSLIYYVQRGVADEMSYITLELDEAIKRMTVKDAYDNGYDKDVIAKCEDVGIHLKEATKATTVLNFTGQPKSKLPSGSKVATKNGMVFITNTDVILDEDGKGSCNATASDYGTNYNCAANKINNFCIKYQGFTSVTNPNEVKDGYDEESISSLLDRYYEYIQNDETSGNVSHYKKWCKDITGVGKANVYECTNELKQKVEGHVLCVVSDSNNRSITSQDKLDEIFNYIETKRPACAKVHVISANEIMLTFSCEILYNSKFISLTEAQDIIKDSIEYYLKNNAFELTSLDVNKLESLAYSSDEIIKLRNFSITLDGTTYTTKDTIDIGADTVIVLDNDNISITEIEL